MTSLKNLLTKQINKAFLIGTGAVALSLAIFSMTSIKDAIKQADLLIMEQASSLTNAAVLANDYLSIQKELSRFVHNLNQTQSFDSQIQVWVDGKLIASAGEKADWSFLTSKVMKSFPLSLNKERSFEIAAIVDPKRIIVRTFEVFLILLFLIGLVHLFVRLLIYKFLESLSKPLMDLISQIEWMSRNLPSSLNKKLSPMPNPVKELSTLAGAIEVFIEQILTLQTKLGKAQLDAGKLEIAKQVAHDIRSPLSALAVVTGSLKDLPEDKRLIIRNAVQRVNDIANDLLASSKKVAASSSGLCATKPLLEEILLPALVDSLVSEKRIQIRDQMGIQIESDFKDSFGSFIKADASDLLRLLSNLINNSVESLNRKTGTVTVAIRAYPQTVNLSISDDGSGIPPEILTKLGAAGISHGKEGTESGSGLGVYHAKKCIEAIGGSFKITSEVGNGTTVHIEFPRIDSPEWFLDSIRLQPDSVVLCLDDDLTIHQIWQERLNRLQVSLKNVEIKNFTSAREFKLFAVNSSSKDAIKETAIKLQNKKMFYLIDYELSGQSIDGLKVIEELGIQENVSLVTSRYEEQDIRRKCANLKIKILPKSLAGFVPIEIEVPKEKYDWVLIDDDELTHMCWKLAADGTGKKFIGFKSYPEFKIKKSVLDFASSIYIDSNLGDGLKGEDVAKELYVGGFKELYLTTGYSADQFPEMDFIKEIMSKSPPSEEKLS